MAEVKIPISHIILTDRHRTDLGDIAELWASIQRTHGLIHPITVAQNHDGTTYQLIAGGRRLAAHVHGGATEIEATLRSSMSLDDIHELELEENLRRKSLIWQEHVLAVDDLHTKRAHKAALLGQEWIRAYTGEMLGCGRASVDNCCRIAKFLRADTQKTGIWACEGQSDALKWILKKQVDDATAELARRTILKPVPLVEVPDYGDIMSPDNAHVEDLSLPKRVGPKDLIRQGADLSFILAAYLQNPHNKLEEFEAYVEYCKTSIANETKTTVSLSGMLHNMSCLDFMKKQGEGWCDHIITDPPYAIDMDMLQQASGGIQNIDDVKDEHEVEENMALLEAFIYQASIAIRDNGFLVFWLDQMQWHSCYHWATKWGFKPQRWPLVWHKTSPCKNGAAYKNFTKDTEIAMVCRKGNASLAQSSPTSVITCGHDEMRETFGHPFVKPFTLWEFISDYVAQPNSLIYEPFAGRGSGVISLLRLGHRVLATELQTNHFNHLTVNVKQHYTETLGEENVTFQ